LYVVPQFGQVSFVIGYVGYVLVHSAQSVSISAGAHSVKILNSFTMRGGASKLQVRSALMRSLWTKMS
jgi:hypothetical protein